MIQLRSRLGCSFKSALQQYSLSFRCFLIKQKGSCVPLDSVEVGTTEVITTTKRASILTKIERTVVSQTRALFFIVSVVVRVSFVCFECAIFYLSHQSL